MLQRHWWDFFRVTHGVLAATDQRMIYVGVPPTELLPREDEPIELREATWSYRDSVRREPSRVYLGTRPAITLSAGDVSETLAYASRDAERVDSVLSLLAAHQRALQEAQAAERRAIDAAMQASRRPIYHVVQQGETLEAIAMRFGTSVDSLRAWNALTRDRIVVGRRLLVQKAQ